MRRLALVVCFAASSAAYSYPENIRYGYTSCSTCHVNPAGGGVLTNYGRGFGEELATVHQDNAGGLAYGLVTPPDWLLVGGDTRYLDYHTVQQEQAFLMQNDAEGALRLGKELTVVASIGNYYGGKGPESRRNYVMWSPNDNVEVRVGHFFPAYGLQLPDHTSATRAGIGYGEGQESYNAEASYRDKFSEIFLTATAGDGTTFTAHSPQGTISPQGNGYTARASAFLPHGVTLGASYNFKWQAPTIYEQTMGPYAMIGVNSHLYLLAEADRRIANGTHFDVSYAELGYEVYRGVHLQATHEYANGSIYGLGLQLFPLAHIEMLAKVKYESITGNVSSELLFHLNW